MFVLDDDEHVRNALCRVLRSGGYTVQDYGCASAFMQGADLTSAPACLLLDLQLPDFSGIELQRRLDGIVPIVFISAQGGMNTAVEAMKAGATDFLTKPVDAAVLIEVTAGALARAPARRSPARAHRRRPPGAGALLSACRPRRDRGAPGPRHRARWQQL